MKQSKIELAQSITIMLAKVVAEETKIKCIQEE